MNGIFSVTIDLDEADKQRETFLAKRHPELYFPGLAFHRSPTDVNATTTYVLKLKSNLYRGAADVRFVSNQSSGI